MTRRDAPGVERATDLLAQRATEGLGPGAKRELEQLLAAHPDLDDEGLDRAAAAVDRAFAALAGEVAEPLPAALRQRVLADAQPHLPPRVRPAADRARMRWFGASALGWYAAAALLALTAFLAWRAEGPEPAPPEPAALRAALVASAGDAITVAWNPPDDPRFRGVSGDVVWSDREQRGFMRLVGMPVNRPTEAQYQLWIVDPDRDARPVDGGVFDIGRDGEVIVSIDAKLPIDAPAAFAITLEQPGGVVVSAGPLLVVAPVPS